MSFVYFLEFSESFSEQGVHEHTVGPRCSPLWPQWCRSFPTSVPWLLRLRNQEKIGTFEGSKKKPRRSALFVFCFLCHLITSCFIRNVQTADELKKLCLRLPADPLVLKAYTERALVDAWETPWVLGGFWGWWGWRPGRAEKLKDPFGLRQHFSCAGGVWNRSSESWLWTSA